MMDAQRIYYVYDYAGGDDGCSRELATEESFDTPADASEWIDKQSTRGDYVIENAEGKPVG